MIPRILLTRQSRLCVLFGLLAIGLLTARLTGTYNSPLDPDVVAADPNVRLVAAANTEFGFRLLTQLNRETPGKNVFFSPFSVSQALTMLLNGAGADTQRDIAATLGLKAITPDRINQANALLLPSLENPDPKVQITVANALWADAGTTFAPTFQTRCARFYGARMDTLDFQSPAAANTINSWVKDSTHGKITALVSPADLANSAGVLTNAVYFHGQWQQKFERSSTQDQPFTLADGATKVVPLMSEVETCSYLETGQFQAASLPYGEGRMSLYVFLPKPEYDLDRFLGTLSVRSWDSWIGRMQPARLRLFLPRFQADYEAPLSRPLTSLGMGSAFRAGADFRPMGLPGLPIRQVFHKALIAVDEDGTVAAAAMALEMAGSVPPPPILMRVDHPFFCAIRDNATGTLLFTGVIRDPR